MSPKVEDLIGHAIVWAGTALLVTVAVAWYVILPLIGLMFLIAVFHTR